MEFIVAVGLATFLFLVGLSFLIQGPPYVPSNDEVTSEIVKTMKSYKPNRILDMGSGDGKVVIALAQAGYTVDGVELNPLLVYKSRCVLKKLGLKEKATIHWGSFWSYNTSSYDVIVLYVIKHIMPRLEKKLLSELKKNTVIFSNYFTFPNLKPVLDKGRLKVYKV